MHRAPKVKKLRARTASACEEAAQDPKAADQGDDNQGPSAAGVKRLGASIKAPALASSKAIAPKAVGTKLKCKRSRVSPTGHAAWLNSYPKVSRWAAQYNLQQLLNQGGGITKISNFLPAAVADGVLADLERLPEKQWLATAASRDLAHNNISHEFWSVRSAKGLDAVFRALSLLLPGELHSFSAAKYCRKHHIEAHDDRAYTQVLMDDGAVVSCSRNIALIVYLTRDWQPEYGGLLLDLEAPGGTRTYVPEFNSAIAFRIPRWHAVTPMTTDRPRYSLFGWWLEPGHKYDLQLRPSPSHVPAAATTSPGQAVTQEGEHT